MNMNMGMNLVVVPVGKALRKNILGLCLIVVSAGPRSRDPRPRLLQPSCDSAQTVHQKPMIMDSPELVPGLVVVSVTVT